MREFTLTLAGLLVLGTSLIAWKAEAMTSAPVRTLETQSMVHKAACFGPGRWCGWGRHRVCL
jgi:hypothetical protein